MSARRRNLKHHLFEFLAERDDERSFTKHDVARWVLDKGKVKHEKGYAEHLAFEKLANEFSDIMREVHTTDAQGRTVRELHAARIGGKTRWNSGRRASRGFMETSFVQRREQAVHDCKHLKADVDSLNDNRFSDNPIQMTFDFTNDLAELEAGEAAQRQGKKEAS